MPSEVADSAPAAGCGCGEKKTWAKSDLIEPNGKFSLRFKASQAEPEFTEIFMTSGGTITAAATKWSTDMSLTGSESAVDAHLDRLGTVSVSLELPSHMVRVAKHAADVPIIDPDARLNTSMSRIGAAISGTLVSTVSGAASEPLHTVLKLAKNDGHVQMGLVYNSWLAHAATVGLSSARLFFKPDDGDEHEVRRYDFWEREERKTAIKAGAVQLVEQYSRTAWAVRQAVVFPPAPSLTKTVFRETVGVANQGYSLLHDVVERGVPLSMPTLNSLLKACVHTDLNHEVKDINLFLSSTERPGLAAAANAEVVASAVGIAVNYLVAYRSDGRNLVGTTGAEFAAAESWLRQLPRQPIEANDCDGSALYALGIFQASENLPNEEESNFPYVRAVKNAVYPFYQPALSVLAAASAEASSGGNVEEQEEHVAGHAVALLMPSLGLLRALARPDGKTIGNTEQLVFDPLTAKIHQEARFLALFPREVVDRLDIMIQKNFTSWQVARDFEDAFKPLAIEGTTPASPILFQPHAQRRANKESDAARDDVAFAKAAPNVMRSLKTLHVGGSKAGSTHRFYKSFVELTFSRSSPLYADAKCRAFGCAASQFVLTRPQPGNAISKAGASPRDLVEDTYSMIPLVSLNLQYCKILDEATKYAGEDVVAPRPRVPMQLDQFQSDALKESLVAFNNLQAHFNECGDDDSAHQVAYIAAFATLVHNPRAVSHFCKTMERVAVGGCVDISNVDGLAKDFLGVEAGAFVSVCALIPV